MCKCGRWLLLPTPAREVQHEASPAVASSSDKGASEAKAQEGLWEVCDFLSVFDLFSLVYFLFLLL